MGKTITDRVKNWTAATLLGVSGLAYATGLSGCAGQTEKPKIEVEQEAVNPTNKLSELENSIYKMVEGCITNPKITANLKRTNDQERSYIISGPRNEGNYGVIVSEDGKRAFVYDQVMIGDKVYPAIFAYDSNNGKTSIKVALLHQVGKDSSVMGDSIDVLHEDGKVVKSGRSAYSQNQNPLSLPTDNSDIQKWDSLVSRLKSAYNSNLAK